VSLNQASRFSLVTEHGTGNTDDRPTERSRWNEKLTVNEFREKKSLRKSRRNSRRNSLKFWSCPIVSFFLEEQHEKSESELPSASAVLYRIPWTSAVEPHIRKRARRQHVVYIQAVPVLLRIRGYKFFFYSLEDREPPHIHVAHAGRYASSGLIH